MGAQAGPLGQIGELAYRLVIGVPAVAERTGTGPPNPESEATRVREGSKGKGGLTQTLTYRSPPKRVSVGGEVRVGVLLGQIDQEGGEDEHQEPDVPGGDQLLREQQQVRPQVGPRRKGVGKRGALSPSGRGGEVGGPRMAPERCWEGDKKYPTLCSSQAPFSTPPIREALPLLPESARPLKPQGTPAPALDPPGSTLRPPPRDPSCPAPKPHF